MNGEMITDQYYDSLNTQQEAHDQAEYDFFCGDMELLKAVQYDF